MLSLTNYLKKRVNAGVKRIEVEVKRAEVEVKRVNTEAKRVSIKVKSLGDDDKCYNGEVKNINRQDQIFDTGSIVIYIKS